METSLWLPWLIFIGGVFCEVTGTIHMKLSEGFTKLVPTVITFTCYAIGLACISTALRRIDIGLAYATWSGLGTTMIATFGILFWNEPFNIPRLVAFALTISGIVGLHLTAQ